MIKSTIDVYKIAPVRDIKLRKWAIIGFSIVSFAGLISFLWVPNLPLSIPILYIVYIEITLYILLSAKSDLFSPLMFFIFFSFLGFGIKLPLLSLFPDTVFFVLNPSLYQYNFQYNISAITYAFFVFLIGYVGFIFGFFTIKKGLKLGIYEKPTHPFILFFIALPLIIIYFYFRSQYHVGIPGYDIAFVSRATRYIYYLLTYGVWIVTGLVFYFALIVKSAAYTTAGVLLFILVALLGALLGWKGTFVSSMLYIILIYYYVDRYKQNVDKRLYRRIMVFVLILSVLFMLFYQFISYYRDIELVTHNGVSLSAFYTDLRQFLNEHHNSGGSGSLISATLLRIVDRVSGLNDLVGITAYFHQGFAINLTDLAFPSFILNLFHIGIAPEVFYTRYILGVDPRIVTTSAPTSWGALYIYGGIIEVIMGMFIIGMLSKLLYTTFISNVVRRDGRWIVFYAITMINIFLPIVFEGTILSSKSFIMLLVVYGFIIFILNTIYPKPHFRKRNYHENRN